MLMVDAEANMYVISNVNGGRGMIVKIAAGSWQQTGKVSVSSSSYFGMESTHHDPAGEYIMIYI